MKAKVSLGLSNKTTTELIEFARQIVTAMTGNVHFTTPNPVLSSITQAATSLETTFNTTNMGSKAKTVQLNSLRAQLKSLLGQLSNYVANIANGDAGIMLSAGMGATTDRTPSQIPAAPLHVGAVSSAAEGQANLHWDRVKGAHVYVIEISDDVAAVNPGTLGTVTPAPSTARSFITWTQADILTKTHAVLNGLTSGIKYAIRVFAVGAKGKGFYSVPVIVKVL
jgi:hypothetical protein